MIGLSFHYYNRVVQEAREVALKAGLVNIRKTIQLYHFVERQYPPDLEGLVRKRLMLPAREDTFFKEEYLSAVAVDPEGHPLDSFGNQYRYDPRNGRVSSGTPGYETW
ncbi:MAG: type II secretion system protein GspG [Candidatus Manganitrophus sp.]|nr:type II secretion system protein GspG [Candidatus Manganitrophus sp.]WDT73357.1 MAG: type II secretion system protein GspG [Candidatus Manganitrophus sp.]